MELINTVEDYKKLIDPIPFARSKEEVFDKRDIYKEIADELVLFMDKTPSSAGISAIQLGARERIFAYRNDRDHKIYIVIEPEVPVFDTKKPKVLGAEGCLSFPNMIFYIVRPKKIVTPFYSFNKKGDIVKFGYEIKDLNARRYLHELDHLEGIVLPLKAIETTGPGGVPLNNPGIPTIKLGGNPSHKYIYKIPWDGGKNGSDYYVEDDNVTFFSNEKINPEGFLKTRITIGYKF